MSSVIQGPNLLSPQYVGEYGNVVDMEGYFIASAASADTATEIDLITLPEGTRINSIQLNWSAQGASGTIQAGWKYANGNAGGSATALLGSTSSVAAGGATNTFIPPDLTALGSSGNSTGVFDSDVIIYLTLGGVIMPSGSEFYLVARGRYVGTK